MKTEINLAVKSPRTKKSAKKLFLFSIVVFSVATLSCIAFFVFNLTLKGEYNGLEEKKTSLIKEMQLLSVKKANILQLQDRLSSINTTLGSRSGLDKKITAVLNLFPEENVSLERISTKNKSFSISILAKNLSEINMIFEKFDNLPNDTKFVKSIELKTLSFDVRNMNYKAEFIFNI